MRILSEEETKLSREARKLRAENNRLEKQLNKNSNEALTDIVVYIRSTNISDFDQETVRRDITQMLLDAQNRGCSAVSVIGGDYKAFCDEIIAEIPKLSKKQRLLTAVRYTLPALSMLFTVWLLLASVKQIIEHKPWYITPMYLSDIMIGAALLLAAILTVVYITKNSFNSKSYIMICLLLLIIAIGAAGELLVPKTVILSPHIAADVALVVVLLIAYKIIDSSLN